MTLIGWIEQSKASLRRKKPSCEVNSGLSLIPLVLSFASCIFLVALLVWEVAEYRSTGQRIQMLREEIERNRREREELYNATYGSG